MSSEIKADLIKDKSGTKTLATLSSSAVTLNSDLVFPAGHVIQTVSNFYDTNNSDTSTSSTFAKVSVTTGSVSYPYGATINNVEANSYVDITMSFIGYFYNGTGTEVGGGFGIYKEDVETLKAHVTGFYWYGSGTSAKECRIPINLHFIDESPATGSNTYTLGYKAYTNCGIKVMTYSTYQAFQCTLKEIAQ